MMKPLIVYYSYGGNTRGIAETIAKELGGDLLELKTAHPYTGGYQAVVDQGQREVERGFMPELKPLYVNMAKYDTVYLGTPVWWYTFAPAVRTFLSEVELSGKTIYPFATNGGWIGHTFEDIRAACPGAHVKVGLNLHFDASTMVTDESELKNWLHR